MANRNRIRAALLLCALLAGLVTGCSSGTSAISDAERDVYDAFFAARGGDGNQAVYLAAATDAAWFEKNEFEAQEWFPYLDSLGGIPMELIEALYRVNRHPALIDGNLLPAEVVILPPDYPPPDADLFDLRCEFNDLPPHIEPWSSDECDIRPYHTVSRVAFSRDGTLALMKYLYSCVSLCGREGFIAFRRDGGHWQLIGERVLWIS